MLLRGNVMNHYASYGISIISTPNFFAHFDQFVYIMKYKSIIYQIFTHLVMFFNLSNLRKDRNNRKNIIFQCKRKPILLRFFLTFINISNAWYVNTYIYI